MAGPAGESGKPGRGPVRPLLRIRAPARSKDSRRGRRYAAWVPFALGLIVAGVLLMVAVIAAVLAGVLPGGR